MVFAKDGKNIAIGDSTAYPSTILAETNSGKVLFIQNDGRQKDYSLGFRFSDYTKLAKAFDIKNGFIVDGGGSSTMVALEENGYKLVNRPSDKDEDGNYGQTRTVVNSVILSYGKDRTRPRMRRKIPIRRPRDLPERPAGKTAHPGGENRKNPGNRRQRRLLSHCGIACGKSRQ